MRRATVRQVKMTRFYRNFYPRSPCGERLACLTQGLPSNCISTHALHAESDKGTAKEMAEGAKFLPTLSMRRATTPNPPIYTSSLISTHALHAESDKPSSKNYAAAGYFYPRSPCGERLLFHQVRIGFCDISTHALHAESDLI